MGLPENITEDIELDDDEPSGRDRLVREIVDKLVEADAIDEPPGGPEAYSIEWPGNREQETTTPNEPSGELQGSPRPPLVYNDFNRIRRLIDGGSEEGGTDE